MIFLYFHYFTIFNGYLEVFYCYCIYIVLYLYCIVFSPFLGATWKWPEAWLGRWKLSMGSTDLSSVTLGEACYLDLYAFNLSIFVLKVYFSIKTQLDCCRCIFCYYRWLDPNQLWSVPQSKLLQVHWGGEQRTGSLPHPLDSHPHHQVAFYIYFFTEIKLNILKKLSKFSFF